MKLYRRSVHNGSSQQGCLKYLYRTILELLKTEFGHHFLRTESDLIYKTESSCCYQQNFTEF